MFRPISGLALLFLCVSCATAEDSELEKVRSKVEKALPGVSRADVQSSPIPGLYEVRKGHAFGYVSADGRYLIQGDLMDLESGEQLTEKRRMRDRLEVLATIGKDDVIAFGPKDAKYEITVFTDIDCGYCRKLHREMADFNAKGIAVRYLFFPRSGPDTPSFHKAQAVWCSADRQKALTDAKMGLPLPTEDTSCKNPVLRHYQAGEQLGVNATPMIILPDGELVRGYVPATALVARLKAGDWN